MYKTHKGEIATFISIATLIGIAVFTFITSAINTNISQKQTTSTKAAYNCGPSVGQVSRNCTQESYTFNGTQCCATGTDCVGAGWIDEEDPSDGNSYRYYNCDEYSDRSLNGTQCCKQITDCNYNYDTTCSGGSFDQERSECCEYTQDPVDTTCRCENGYWNGYCAEDAGIRCCQCVNGQWNQYCEGEYGLACGEALNQPSVDTTCRCENGYWNGYCAEDAGIRCCQCVNGQWNQYCEGEYGLACGNSIYQNNSSNMGDLRSQENLNQICNVGNCITESGGCVGDYYQEGSCRENGIWGACCVKKATQGMGDLRTYESQNSPCISGTCSLGRSSCNIGYTQKGSCKENGNNGVCCENDLEYQKQIDSFNLPECRGTCQSSCDLNNYWEDNYTKCLGSKTSCCVKKNDGADVYNADRTRTLFEENGIDDPSQFISGINQCSGNNDQVGYKMINGCGKGFSNIGSYTYSGTQAFSSESIIRTGSCCMPVDPELIASIDGYKKDEYAKTVDKLLAYVDAEAGGVAVGSLKVAQKAANASKSFMALKNEVGWLKAATTKSTEFFQAAKTGISYLLSKPATESEIIAQVGNISRKAELVEDIGKIKAEISILEDLKATGNLDDLNNAIRSGMRNIVANETQIARIDDGLKAIGKTEQQLLSEAEKYRTTTLVNKGRDTEAKINLIQDDINKLKNNSVVDNAAAIAEAEGKLAVLQAEKAKISGLARDIDVRLYEQLKNSSTAEDTVAAAKLKDIEKRVVSSQTENLLDVAKTNLADYRSGSLMYADNVNKLPDSALPVQRITTSYINASTETDLIARVDMLEQLRNSQNGIQPARTIVESFPTTNPKSFTQLVREGDLRGVVGKVGDSLQNVKNNITGIFTKEPSYNSDLLSKYKDIKQKDNLLSDASLIDSNISDINNEVKSLAKNYAEKSQSLIDFTGTRAERDLILDEMAMIKNQISERGIALNSLRNEGSVISSKVNSINEKIGSYGDDAYRAMYEGDKKFLADSKKEVKEVENAIKESQTKLDELRKTLPDNDQRVIAAKNELDDLIGRSGDLNLEMGKLNQSAIERMNKLDEIKANEKKIVDLKKELVGMVEGDIATSYKTQAIKDLEEANKTLKAGRTEKQILSEGKEAVKYEIAGRKSLIDDQIREINNNLNKLKNDDQSDQIVKNRISQLNKEKDVLTKESELLGKNLKDVDVFSGLGQVRKFIDDNPTIIKTYIPLSTAAVGIGGYSGYVAAKREKMASKELDKNGLIIAEKANNGGSLTDCTGSCVPESSIVDGKYTVQSGKCPTAEGIAYVCVKNSPKAADPGFKPGTGSNTPGGGVPGKMNPGAGKGTGSTIPPDGKGTGSTAPNKGTGSSAPTTPSTQKGTCQAPSQCLNPSNNRNSNNNNATQYCMLNNQTFPISQCNSRQSETKNGVVGCRIANQFIPADCSLVTVQNAGLGSYGNSAQFCILNNQQYTISQCNSRQSQYQNNISGCNIAGNFVPVSCNTAVFPTTDNNYYNNGANNGMFGLGNNNSPCSNGGTVTQGTCPVSGQICCTQPSLAQSLASNLGNLLNKLTNPTNSTSYPSINLSPTPNISITPSPTPVGGSGLNNPNGTDVTFDLKLKMHGITKPKEAINRLKVLVTIVDTTATSGIKAATASAEFVSSGSAIFTGSVKFSKVEPRGGYYLLIKGPKHVQKKICSASPTESSPGEYSCKDLLTVSSGVNELNLSNIYMMVGDVPKQDGVVNSIDFANVRTRFGKLDYASLEVADLNLDGVVNSQDFSLIIQTLQNTEGADQK